MNTYFEHDRAEGRRHRASVTFSDQELITALRPEMVVRKVQELLADRITDHLITFLEPALRDALAGMAEELSSCDDSPPPKR